MTRIDPKRTKPTRPEGFPLYPGASGRWEARVGGRLRRFAKWEDAEQALEEYQQLLEEIKARQVLNIAEDEREPDQITVGQLATKYLAAQRRRVGARKRPITQATYNDQVGYRDRLFAPEIPELDHQRISRLRWIDLRCEHFDYLAAALPANWGCVTWDHHVRWFYAMARWGVRTGEIRSLPPYGDQFLPSCREDRELEKDEQAKKRFSAEQIATILTATRDRPIMQAMIWLGVNCGFHPIDFDRLRHEDLEPDGYIRLRRGKLGRVKRCAWLWPETIQAIRKAREIPVNPKPQYHGLVFIHRQGGPYGSTLGDQFARLLKSLDMHTKGVKFHAFRNTFKHTAEEYYRKRQESPDFPAINLVLGHRPGDPKAEGAGAVYRDGDIRTRHVCEAVRQCLLPALREHGLAVEPESETNQTDVA